MEQKKVGAGIGIMILDGNKVLLGRRNDDAEKASSLLKGEGTWTMPGGKLRFGESFEDGAKREVHEETGLVIHNPKVISISNDIVPDAHFVTVGLLATEFSGTLKVMEPDEITEWKFFPVDKLPKPIFFPSEKLLLNYLAKKFY